MKLSKECVFFGHGKAHHECGGWKKMHVLRYYPYLIPEDVGLKYAIAFPCGDPIQSYVQNKREAIPNGVDLLYMFDEGEFF